MLSGILWNKQIYRNKIQIFKPVVKSLIYMGLRVWNLSAKLRSRLLARGVNLTNSAKHSKFQQKKKLK